MFNQLIRTTDKREMVKRKTDLINYYKTFKRSVKISRKQKQIDKKIKSIPEKFPDNYLNNNLIKTNYINKYISEELSLL